ncbi:hypothetical protein [Streptomyces sp. NPDC060031]|uniref:hypothetical protein n=1 Tax=Streptomyces sp. NPDC060031 TaxID=3347043 RepID=UPI003677C491
MLQNTDFMRACGPLAGDVLRTAVAPGFAESGQPAAIAANLRQAPVRSWAT